MTEQIEKPRCPRCNKVQADWIIEAKFTCPRCGTEFIIGQDYLTILTKLTKQAIGDISKIA